MPLSAGAGERGHYLIHCGLGQGLPPYQVASLSIHPFGHNRHGPKIGGCATLGGAGSPSNTKSPGLRPRSIPSGIFIHAAIWPQHICAKNWEAVPLWGGGAGFPWNTMWPGPRPSCLPSFILIRPTVWPQCTNVTDTSDRQDRQTGQATVW